MPGPLSVRRSTTEYSSACVVSCQFYPLHPSLQQRLGRGYSRPVAVKMDRNKPAAAPRYPNFVNARLLCPDANECFHILDNRVWSIIRGDRYSRDKSKRLRTAESVLAHHIRCMTSAELMPMSSRSSGVRSKLRKPITDESGLPTSCAMPDATRPTVTNRSR